MQSPKRGFTALIRMIFVAALLGDKNYSKNYPKIVCLEVFLKDV